MHNLEFREAKLRQLVLHRVGSRSQEEGIKTAKQPMELNDEVRQQLTAYFVDSFKIDDWFRFDHETDINMNEVYTYCSYIFEHSENFYEQSVNILKHLYERSNHTKIRGGELYVVYFEDLIIGDELLPAVGIFKAENKDTYVKLHIENEEEWSLQFEQGTNLSKLDKGCLVLNTQAEDGYRVVTIDLKSSDAKYWRDDFLKLCSVEDENFFTRNYLNLCKSFVKEACKEDDKNEQVAFVNRSLDYFDTHHTFDYEEFKAEVFPENEQKSFAFDDYKRQFEENEGYIDEEPFNISQPAVKKMRRSFKNIIQLDTEVEIKLHSTEAQANGNLERGYDEERKMFYYKIFFNEEK